MIGGALFPVPEPQGRLWHSSENSRCGNVGNQALVFLFDLGEAYWTWLPEEPESTLNQAENEEGAD